MASETPLHNREISKHLQHSSTEKELCSSVLASTKEQVDYQEKQDFKNTACSNNWQKENGNLSKMPSLKIVYYYYITYSENLKNIHVQLTYWEMVVFNIYTKV